MKLFVSLLLFISMVVSTPSVTATDRHFVPMPDIVASFTDGGKPILLVIDLSVKAPDATAADKLKVNADLLTTRFREALEARDLDDLNGKRLSGSALNDHYREILTPVVADVPGASDGIDLLFRDIWIFPASDCPDWARARLSDRCTS